MNLIIFAILLVLPTFSYALDYRSVQLDKSHVTFVSKQMSVPVEGVFKKFNAQIQINPALAEKGKANIEIDLTSIDVGSMEANDEVKDKNWFNVTEFPKAKFNSAAVKPLGGGNFEAHGKITIKGKTVDVRSTFTMKEDKEGLNIDGAFPLNRLDFGIGSGLWSDTAVVANEVQIKFHFLLK
jgi:polyisoprenoid-binding protein YceI